MRQKHHEKKEVTDVKPEKHSLLGKLMKVRYGMCFRILALLGSTEGVRNIRVLES